MISALFSSILLRNETSRLVFAATLPTKIDTHRKIIKLYAFDVFSMKSGHHVRPSYVKSVIGGRHCRSPRLDSVE